MTSTSHPDREARRLAALAGYGLLDTPAEPVFDALTRAAAQLCGTPMAMLSLVDRDRHWVKSAVGIAQGTAFERAHSPCAQAILCPDRPTEIVDARTDPRCADWALVREAPGIGLYAGVPLVTRRGEAIGTLAVLDRAVRSLDEAQRGTLRELAAVAMALCEGRRSRHRLERLAGILDCSLNEVIVFDPDTLAISYVNDGACRNLKRDAASLAGMPLTAVQVWHSERVLRGVLASLARAPNEPLSLQIECRRADGSSYPVEARFQCVEDPAGRLGIVIANDVSEREAAMSELLASEERYRTLYQRTPAMLFSFDAGGRIMNASDRWLEALGYAYEEVGGRRLTEFVAPDARVRAETLVDTLAPAGGCRDQPLSFVRRDGETIETLLSAIVERDRRGHVLRTLAVLTDVTERNQAERALHRSTAEFEAIFRSIPDAVAFMGVDRSIALVNPAFPRIMGYRAHEVLGRSTEMLFEDPALYQRIERARYRLEAPVDLRPHEVG
ncbi:MAG: PAS domain S-box protein, partial [Burkholderiales bacterium]